MSLFPFNKWVSGIILLLVIYYGYGVFGPLIETHLPDAAETADSNVYVNNVISNVSNNFFIGVIILVLGTMLYLLIAGIPGQQEERMI